jgi:hypothetical protein
VDAAVNGSYTAQDLSRELAKAASAADGVQHARIVVEDRAVVFCLYVQASDPVAAGARAEQLCRRTMAAVSAKGAWQVRCTQYGP